MTCRQLSNGYSPVGAWAPPMPALLTAMLSPPNVSTVRWTIAST